MEKFKDIKSTYMNVETPNDLDMKIKRSFKKAQRATQMKTIRRITVGAASFMLIFTASVNSNQDFAMTLSKIPVL